LEKGITQRAIEIAKSFKGARELGQNRGEEIDLIQKEFGFKGVQYCVLFTLYCYKKAIEEAGFPYKLPHTASSQTLYEEARKAGVVSADFDLMVSGDIVIWRKFKLWQGHAAIALSTPNPIDKSFLTIEGNTQPDTKGDQRDGGGIYQRFRYAKKADFVMDAFYLRGYIKMAEWMNNLGIPRQVIG